MSVVTMTYNSISSANKGVIITNIKRQILPGTNHSLINVPGRPGSYIQPREPRDRVITVECLVSEASLEALRTKDLDIADWLYQTEYKPLQFSDQADKYYMAIQIEPIDEEQILAIGKFMLTFLAEPFLYEAEQSQAFVADAATANNPGTAVTPPRFAVTFTGAASEWKVSLSTGEYIRIVHDFAATDTLEVNCLTGAIYHNGSRAMNLLDWQNSTLFNLARGGNTLAITPGGVCNTTIYWTPRYL